LLSTPIFSISTSQTSPGFSQGCGARHGHAEGRAGDDDGRRDRRHDLGKLKHQVGTSKIRSSVCCPA